MRSSLPVRADAEPAKRDQLLERDRKRGGMVDPRAHSGSIRQHVERCLHGAVDRHRGGVHGSSRLPGRSGVRSKRPFEATITRSVRSRSTGLADFRNEPQATAARPLRFLPDDLAAQQQPEVVLEDADDIGGETAIRLAAEVGDVDGDPPSWLQHPGILGEDVAQHLEILDVRRRDLCARCWLRR